MCVVRTGGLVLMAAWAVVVTGKSGITRGSAGCVAWAGARSISATTTIATTTGALGLALATATATIAAAVTAWAFAFAHAG